jgi:hypothetical protein
VCSSINCFGGGHRQETDHTECNADCIGHGVSTTHRAPRAHTNCCWRRSSARQSRPPHSDNYVTCVHIDTVDGWWSWRAYTRIIDDPQSTSAHEQADVDCTIRTSQSKWRAVLKVMRYSGIIYSGWIEIDTSSYHTYNRIRIRKCKCKSTPRAYAPQTIYARAACVCAGGAVFATTGRLFDPDRHSVAWKLILPMMKLPRVIETFSL